MDRQGWQQREMIDLFTRHGLSLDDEDSQGVTPQDHLANKALLPVDTRRANELTRQYKECERNMFTLFILDDKCIRCGDWIDPYRSLEDVSLPHDLVATILTLRTECNDVYRAYLPAFSPTIVRHQYVIDWYQKKLDSLNVNETNRVLSTT